MTVPASSPCDPQILPDDVRLLKDMVRELLTALQQRTHKLEGVQQRIDQLLRRLYGPRAERWDPEQPLFPEILQALAELDPPSPPAHTAPDDGIRAQPANAPGVVGSICQGACPAVVWWWMSAKRTSVVSVVEACAAHLAKRLARDWTMRWPACSSPRRIDSTH